MPVHTPVSPREALPAASREAANATAALAVVHAAARAGEVVHVEHIPGQGGTTTDWPDSVHPEVAAALAARGIHRPWTHQAQAAALAGDSQNVIIATPAASGKSAGYLAAALSAIQDGGTALYIAPTKALAADQLRVVRDLKVPGVRPACHDGDSTRAERSWAQSHANYLLTNPDMLHGSMLPGHERWRGFFKRLRVVIVDECHAYRGVFGSHVAQVLRRLRRIAAHHALAEPVFILASATIADPARCALLLTGLDAVPVTADGSPRAPLSFVLFAPGGTTPLSTPRQRGETPLSPPSPGEPGTDRRAPGPPAYRAGDDPLSTPGASRVPGWGRPRSPGLGKTSATNAASELLGALVTAGVPALAFVRSRRGAEWVALSARSAAPEADSIAAYRSGYLADDRRDLEAGLRDGRIAGLAATSALELGIDVAGLDAVLIAGWPGTWASLWQQAGRAGRAGRAATAVFIARDDPLDTYLVRHPEALLGHPPEAAILDPSNPYVLAPHLAAAAAELPLTDQDLSHFYRTPAPPPILTALVEAGDLRRRDSGWHWARRGHPARRISLRGSAEARPIRIVEESTGRLVGTMDEPSAHHFVHDGAVYVHQGDTYLVRTLDLADRVALVECHDPGYVTRAREIADIKVINVLQNTSWGEAQVAFGEVRVSRQVVSFAQIRPDAASSAFRAPQVPLSLPPRELATQAFWLEVPSELANHAAAHAAEHAAIGILPLVAACDPWDVAGASIVGTRASSVYVHDTQEGGAGFAERGFHAARDWLGACAEAIESCPCEAGCPSCVQSARCGTGNTPLSKAGAIALLHGLLAGK